MKVTKRSGKQVDFDRLKIETAILKAFNEVDGEITDSAREFAKNTADSVSDRAVEAMSIEIIQDEVESALMSSNRKDVAKAYMLYRDRHELDRTRRVTTDILDVIHGNSEYWKTENSNKNMDLFTTQKDYVSGIQSTELAKHKIFSKEAIKAHEAGIIHIHKQHCGIM